MKKIFFILLLISQPAVAHHTKQHTMLLQNSARVITETRHGTDNSSALSLWSGTAAMLAIGVIKLFRKK